MMRSVLGRLVLKWHRFPSRFFVALWPSSIGLGLGGSHHIYKAGLTGDSCCGTDFQNTYWTSAAQPAKGSALVGTAFAQKIIWQHQHPSDCTAVKYLIWLPSHNGIGSNFHCMGQVLAYAINLDRVLVLAHDPDHPYYDPTYCGNNANYHDCFFEPVSSCSLSDARNLAGLTDYEFSRLTEVRWLEADKPNEAVVKLSLMPEQHNFAPSIFGDFLATSPIDPAKHQYWWKAQSVAFLVRPNERTLSEIRKRKKLTFHQHIQPGTISCHIRHGDKWAETELTEDKSYVRALEELMSQAKEQNKSLKREVFLSTEDPLSVAYFRNLTGWTTHFTHVPRKPDRYVSNMQYAQKIGKATEILNSLVNLDLALDCDAWVGTLTSNWCRLIDEMRSTVRCKSDGVYWDAQQTNPPSDLVW